MPRRYDPVTTSLCPTPAFIASLPALTGWLLLLAAGAWAARSGREPAQPGGGDWGWWILLAGVLIAFRWPLIWLPHELYPDESQMLAGALTLRHDPVFWRSVDGGTAGPVDYFLLLPAAFFPGVAGYAVARLTATLLVWGTLVAAGATITRLAGRDLARVAVLPALAFAAFTTSPEFIHYSSELGPGLLLALAGLLVARQADAPSRLNLWGAALLLGTVPFAKLQAGPIAACLGLALVLIEVSAGLARNIGRLILVALLPLLSLVGMLALAGSLDDMIIPYFGQNILYARSGRQPLSQVTAELWSQSVTNGYHALWLAGSLLFCTGAAVWARNRPAPLRRYGWAAAGLLGITVICVLSPGRPYHHYLHLLTLPLTLLAGIALARVAPSSATGRHPLRTPAVTLFLLCGLLPQVALKLSLRADPYEHYNTIATVPSAEHRRLIALIKSLARPGEPLGLWGWRSSLYVETGLRQGTRLAHTESVFVAGPAQKYYLRRYFEDIAASAPPVFVDTAGPGNFRFDRRSLGHELFPLLRDWVDQHYQLVADLDGVRAYARRDRLAAAPHSPEPAPTP